MDNEILWRLTPEEETVIKMIRGLRNNPDTRDPAIREEMYRLADKATNERNQ